MLLARTGDVADRIRREQPLVRAVTVTRDWPSTLRISSSSASRSPPSRPATRCGWSTRTAS
jgi:hypothetical protein